MEDRKTPPAPPKRPEPGSREARLAAALRENLKRRKAQSRAREEQVPPATEPKSTA